MGRVGALGGLHLRATVLPSRTPIRWRRDPSICPPRPDRRARGRRYRKNIPGLALRPEEVPWLLFSKRRDSARAPCGQPLEAVLVEFDRASRQPTPRVVRGIPDDRIVTRHCLRRGLDRRGRGDALGFHTSETARRARTHRHTGTTAAQRSNLWRRLGNGVLPTRRQSLHLVCTR
jgi:hypothetical protein